MKTAFKMKLYDGMVEEYEKRHNNVFPELEELFKKAGVKEYSIWFDEETNMLFGFLDVEDENLWNSIPETEACGRWWEFMASVMETNEDNSPVSIDLQKVYDFKNE